MTTPQVHVFWSHRKAAARFLVEIQALVDDAHGFTPKRLTVGLEQNRLSMLLAVLNRHGGIACFDQDVFLNAVGGVKIGEPAADLAVILAMLSSFRNRPMPEKTVVFGEIGLSGEVRPVARGQERLKEAENSASNAPSSPKANMPRPCQRVSKPENLRRQQFAGSD